MLGRALGHPRTSVRAHPPSRNGPKIGVPERFRKRGRGRREAGGKEGRKELLTSTVAILQKEIDSCAVALYVVLIKILPNLKQPGS